MTENFRLEDTSRESRTLFSHPDADARFGASVFWVRQGMLPEDEMREFLVLETLRETARPDEWPALSSGYRLEIGRMQGEILDYLVQGAPRRPEGASV